MELFYAHKVSDGIVYLDAEESAHCVRVLRHRAGDVISVTDGSGSLLCCEILDASPKEVSARVVSEQAGWGAHPYFLRMAVCPTKNIDRFEWFVEKAVELGVDEIVPLIGDHSERRSVRTDRLQRIAVSAAKQSLKAAVPQIAEPISVKDFVVQVGRVAAVPKPAECQSVCPDFRLIAYCSDDVAPRGSIVDALAAAGDGVSADGDGKVAVVTVLIGPEGDFSQDEVRAALDAGFIPVHLGPSRLRTETAAITAVEAVYLNLGISASPYDSSRK